MRSENQTIYIIFIPLLLAFVVMVLLGTLFVRGYDVGNAIPHPTSEVIADEIPHHDPSLEPIVIIDTAELPQELPDVPTPTKLPNVAQHAQLRQQSSPQAPRPLPPIAEAATNAAGSVADTVHNAIEQLPVPVPAESAPQIQTALPPQPNN